MFQVESLVVYGSNGVCRVTAVGAPYGDDKLYYTLAPMQSTQVIYTPVGTKVPMRPVLSRDAAEELIRGLPEVPGENVEHMNIQTLSRYYQTAFRLHDCGDLVRLLKTIREKNAAARKSGKKPGRLEEKYQKCAEELLYGELSVALDLLPDQIPQYIQETLREEARPSA